MISTPARENGWLPNSIIWSPSFESSTFSSAVAQYSNEAFNAATSLSLGSVSAIFASGAAIPEIFEHRPLLDSAMCMTRCANEFISGVGLKPYLSAGMASAAATMFFEKRGNWFFTAVLTGLATVSSLAASCVSVAAFVCGMLAAGAACCARALPAISVTAIANHRYRFMAICLLPFVRKHTLRLRRQQQSFSALPLHLNLVLFYAVPLEYSLE